jgi:Rieske Fe-S protein
MSTTHHSGSTVPTSPVGSTEPAGVGESPDDQFSRREWVRRTAIAGTAIAAGTGLAACGTSTPTSSGPRPGPTHASVPGTVSSARPGTTPPSAAGTTSSAKVTPRPPVTDGDTPSSLVVGKVSRVPVGGGVIYPSHGVVVTQPTSGTFKCFSSSCTHLGCTVDKVAAGLIQCPCHGARFSIADGSVKAGPAPRPLPVQKFTIVDGAVVLD